MAPAKCSYTVFSHRKGCQNRFDLKLFDGLIPYDDKPVSLGIMFDECINFRPPCTKTKRQVRFPTQHHSHFIAQVLETGQKTLISIYKALIDSVLDYSSFICSGLFDELTFALHAIQNAAMRAIYHVPRKDHTSTYTLCSMANLDKVNIRMEELNRRYLQNAIRTDNPLIEEAVVGYIA